MLMFMSVSIAWGVLFTTGVLEEWHARVLLIIHGFAGVLWGPASQLLLHDIVEPGVLPSAVRLGATARYLGMLSGPAVGGALLLVFGPAHGIFINALIYLPMILWLWKAPYGPKFRSVASVAKPAVRGVWRSDHDLQQYPQQRDGAVHGPFWRDWWRCLLVTPTRRRCPGLPLISDTATPVFHTACCWPRTPPAPSLPVLYWRAGACCTPRHGRRWCWRCPGASRWARSPWSGFIPFALALLFAAGFLELSFNSMAQALVQLSAPAAIRGRVIGIYSMAASGMRTFSGITVGLVGGIVGIHYSLSVSAGSSVRCVGHCVGHVPRRLNNRATTRLGEADPARVWPPPAPSPAGSQLPEKRRFCFPPARGN